MTPWGWELPGEGTTDANSAISYIKSKDDSRVDDELAVGLLGICASCIGLH